MNAADMKRLTRDLPTKAAKIRALAAAGVPRAEIARFLEIRYQHVRNVLTGAVPQAASSGFGETAASTYLPPERPRPSLAGDGSVVIPPELAALFGAKSGDRFVAVEEDGGLWIGTRAAGVRHAQAIVRQSVPEGVSLVDELLEMRRQEVAREEEEERRRDIFRL